MKWEWPAPSASRVKSAKSVKLNKIAYENGEPYTTAIGSNDEIYNVSLYECDCGFYIGKRGSEPCKHMVRLAMDLNLLNASGLSQEDTVRELKDEIARAAGYYYVFHEPIITDLEYDTLKNKYQHLFFKE